MYLELTFPSSTNSHETYLGTLQFQDVQTRERLTCYEWLFYILTKKLSRLRSGTFLWKNKTSFDLDRYFDITETWQKCYEAEISFYKGGETKLRFVTAFTFLDVLSIQHENEYANTQLILSRVLLTTNIPVLPFCCSREWSFIINLNYTNTQKKIKHNY